MEKTTEKNTKVIKLITAVAVSVLLVASIAVSAVCIVSADTVDEPELPAEVCSMSAQELDEAYNWMNEPVEFDLTAGKGALVELNIPERTEAIINVIVKENGYYKIYASKDEISGQLPSVFLCDENDNIKYLADRHEDTSALLMYLEKGVHRFGTSNRDYSAKSKFTFSAVPYNEYIESIDFGKAIDMDFVTDVILQPDEIKVLKITNTKDLFTNFICADGKGLYVQLLDEKLTSCGYDSSMINEQGLICQYVMMDDEATDVFYAVVSNESQEDATVTYKTEMQVFCEDAEALKVNVPEILQEDGSEIFGQALYTFTPDQTREYDFIFKAEPDAELELLVRHMVDYNDVPADVMELTENGELKVEDVKLEAGETYAVIINSYSYETRSAQVTVK